MRALLRRKAQPTAIPAPKVQGPQWGHLSFQNTRFHDFRCIHASACNYCRCKQLTANDHSFVYRRGPFLNRRSWVRIPPGIFLQVISASDFGLFLTDVFLSRGVVFSVQKPQWGHFSRPPEPLLYPSNARYIPKLAPKFSLCRLSTS